MHAFGITLKKQPNGKYNVYFTRIHENGEVEYELTSRGEDRVKAAAIREAELQLRAVSQMIQRNQVDWDVSCSEE